jgi:hypothetical protein
MNKRIKYPRTSHLPWSPGYTDDDVHLDSTNFFVGKQILCLEKMDGGNTTMYPDYIHARSIDSVNHLSRNWVKSFHSTFCYHIPDGWRFCGEDVYAKHSIHYQNLESYLYLFAIYNNDNICLSWNDTLEWANLLELTTPKVFYEGIYDENIIKNITLDLNKVEGYVIRIKDSFHYDDFSKSVAKWVRKDHVTSDKHWTKQPIIPNILKHKE